MNTAHQAKRLHQEQSAPEKHAPALPEAHFPVVSFTHKKTPPKQNGAFYPVCLDCIYAISMRLFLGASTVEDGAVPLNWLNLSCLVLCRFLCLFLYFAQYDYIESLWYTLYPTHTLLRSKKLFHLCFDVFLPKNLFFCFAHF